MEPLLEGAGLRHWFGGVRALDAVDFRLARGEVLGLIGPNGAGKTTLINVVGGSLRLASGTIRLRGRSIGALPAHERARLGIARSFQVSRAFLGMTVADNIRVGALFGTAADGGERLARAQRIGEILDFLGLGARRHDRVQALNVPDRKKVDLGRALAMGPEVLLLDELMAGLNPTDMESVMGVIREINRRGVSLVIIEHVMKVIVDLCPRVMVLHHGRKIADGPTAEVMHDRTVMEAYLGPKYHEHAAAAARGG